MDHDSLNKPLIENYIKTKKDLLTSIHGPVDDLRIGDVPTNALDAEGIKTTLHYAADLDNDANRAFRDAYEKGFGKPANVFAVQGYDTASLLLQAMTAVEGDSGATAELIAAIEGATIADSAIDRAMNST